MANKSKAQRKRGSNVTTAIRKGVDSISPQTESSTDERTVATVALPDERIGGLPTYVVRPRLVAERGSDARARLRKVAMHEKRMASSFDWLGVVDNIDPALAIAVFQASGLLESEDAKFSTRDYIEPLSLGEEGMDETERLRREVEYSKRFYGRAWYEVDENSLAWESVSLWGRHVAVVDVSRVRAQQSQPTSSGMVEQWRELMQLAIQYRKAVDDALSDGELLTEAGFLPSELTARVQFRDRQRIILGGEGELLLVAAAPRAIVEHLREPASQSTNYEGFWERGRLMRNENGEEMTDANGKYVYAERWECTHQSTYAGSAVLAWAFAQRRLRRMFDALKPIYRTQMPATAQCLVHLGPILGWLPRDFDLVKQVELELIAVAPMLVKAGTSTRSIEPSGWTEPNLQSFFGWSKEQLCERMGNISGSMFDRIREAAGLQAPPKGGKGVAKRYTVTEVLELIGACERVDKNEHRVQAKNWAACGEKLRALLRSTSNGRILS